MANIVIIVIEITWFRTAQGETRVPSGGGK